MAKRRVQRVVMRGKKKNAKRRRLKRIFLLVSTVILAEAIILYGYIYLPGMFERSGFLRIKGVSVSGVKASERLSKLEGRLGVWRQRSAFSFKGDEVRDDILSSFPEYKVKRCRYSLRGRVLVDLEQREGLAYISTGSGKILVDDEGVQFIAPAEKDIELPELIFFDRKSKNELVRFLALWKNEKLVLPLPLRKVVAGKLGEIDIFLKDGTKISWGEMEFDADRIQYKFKRLSVVIENALRKYGKLKYINMRYIDDGRILVRPDRKVETS